MLKRFHHWMRRVYVADAILSITLVVVVMVWIGQWIITPWLNRAILFNLDPEEAIQFDIFPLHEVLLLAFAVAYGFFRSYVPHPINHKKYGIWLAQTPWRWGQPLPLGPIQLVWQDAVVLGTMMVLALLPPMLKFSPLYIPVAFTAVYCVSLIPSQLFLKIYWTALAFFGFVVVGVVAHSNPLVLLLLSAAMYGTTYLGLCQSFRDFPYTEEKRSELGLLPFEKPKQPVVPWLMIPETAPSILLTRDGNINDILKAFRWPLVVSIFIGTVMFCFAYISRNLPEPVVESGLLKAHGISCTVFVLIRIFTYLASHWPPISMAGRIATRRFIIPGYDIVFVGPLVTILAAFVLPTVLLWINITPIVAVPLATTATIWLSLVLPPSFERWHYTGHFRAANVSGNGQTMVRL